MSDIFERPMSTNEESASRAWPREVPMKARQTMSSHRRWTLRIVGAWIAIAAVWGSIQADDRDLLRERAADPLVFIVFDTSGSMNLTPVCSAGDACEDIDPYDRACTSECTMGDATCAQVCPDFGCVELSDEDDLPPIELVFDDTDMAVTTINGAWPVDAGAVDPLGGSAITDGNTGKGSKDVTFTVGIAETRRYKVFLHVPQSETWATNVPVTVGGTINAETVSLDQRFVPEPVDPEDPTAGPDYNPWKLVGVYPFDAGATATVRVDTDGTDGPVVVDGIRFLSEVKKCDRMGYRCSAPLCPNGDCPPQLSGDDPASKFSQAKQALYEVLDGIPFVRFGFGSFEQDRPRAFAKHWLYRVRTNELATTDPQDLVILPENTVFPRPGDEDVFGLNGDLDPSFLWECNGFRFVPGVGFVPDLKPGCDITTPANLADPFERARVHRIPKLGAGGNLPITLWIKERVDDPDTFRVTYTPVSGAAYGNPTFEVDMLVERCTNTTCSTAVEVGDERIAYDLKSDFFGWDSNPPPFGFDIRNALDTSVSNSCGIGFNLDPSGLDPNDDTQNGGSTNDPDFDVSRGVNLKFLTTSDPSGRSNSSNDFVFDAGDIIPWDWEAGADHAEDIQKRLAPNTVTDPGAAPDFRVARYFVDLPQSGDNGRLRLADGDASNGIERPLVPRGATPLGASLSTFQDWFNTFATEAKDGGTLADPIIDLDWSCREKFVLMLTDGDETCGGNPCNVALTLNNGTDPVKTFVVGFGLENRPGNQLTCIAANGGTGQPFFPRNKDELVETLTDIFEDIQARSRSFASASLPAVQASSSDKIFFSSFVPLPGKPYWPGRVDVFREPLLEEGEIFGGSNPPVCRSCDRFDLDSGCHLFNVGYTILAQAPTDPQIDLLQPNANLGEARNERRVFYPMSIVPADTAGTIAQPVPLRLFTLPNLDSPTTIDEPIIEDLAEVLVRPSDFDDTQTAVAQLATIRDPIKALYRNLFRIKNDADFADTECTNGTPVGAPATWQAGDYLLGDIFHTTTTVTAGPQNLGFLRQDLCGVGQQPEPNNCVAFDASQQVEAKARGYRAHAARGGWYRRMLTVGANDGQLHFFDAGVRTVIDEQEVFSDGTGTELFSIMPRLVMPVVREQAAPINDRQIYSVDGSFSIEDVFIDAAFAAAPEESEREWRKVLIGGLREAGDRLDDNRTVEGFVPGYYALDITQPDSLVHPETPDGFVLEEEYIPSEDDQIALGVLPSCLEIDTDGALVPDTSPNCLSVAGTALPFPAYKWEFTDRMYFFDSPGVGQPDESGWYELDEDRNGLHDLANTWSRPLIGSIRVFDAGEETVRWVAIFGGGVDPVEKDPPNRGNWLYMIDIETGRTIYKRQLVGAVVADVTGRVDVRGILQAVYVGTTAGLMYKVDLREPATFSSLDLEPADMLDWPGGSDVTVQRLLDVAWTPFPIFDTEGKPIYQTPALVQVPVVDEVALAWGSGDREDLWSRDAAPGRFYMILDDDFSLPLSGIPLPPLTERDFVTFDFNAPLVGVDALGLPLVDPPDFLTDSNLLTNDGLPAHRGWIMRFPLDARVTTRASVLAGVTIFTVFQPRFNPVTATEEPCRRIGTSRTFIVDARNGDALTTLKNLRDPDLLDDRGLEGGDGAAASGINVNGGPPITGDCGDRCSIREGFATPPFVSFTGTKNTPSSANNPAVDPLAGPVMQRLMANLKRSFFPPGCHFNDTFSHMIRMQFDNTSVRNLVAIPVGVCPSDWIEGKADWTN